MPLVGCGQYAFVALTNKKMRRAYRACFAESDTYLSEIVMTVIRIRLALQDPDFRSLVHNTTKLSDAAARAGNMEVLPATMKPEEGLLWGISTSSAAFEANQLDMVKHLFKTKEASTFPRHGLPELLGAAIRSGHLNMVQWLLKRGLIIVVKPIFTGLQWRVMIGRRTLDGMAYAAELGHHDMVYWLKAQGCDVTDEFCSGAIKFGSVELVDFGIRNGGVWQQENWYTAAKLGRVHVLEWAHTNVQRINHSPFSKQVCREAAFGGSITCLEWFRIKGFALDYSHCHIAARCGHLEALQWLRRHKCAWDEDIVETALAHNRFELFCWCIENGCPYNHQACREAAVENEERIAFVTFLDSLE